MLREQYSEWTCGKHTLTLTRPRIMGILNVTPDSFSDGDPDLSVSAAIERGLLMLDQGADIIDIGGESTRPGHTPVSEDEEAKRVVPVIRGILAKAPDAILSIDTRHAEVAKLCVRLGVSIINDVSGFTDPAMVDVAAQTKAGCLIMHWNKTGLGTHTPRREVQLDETRPAINQQARSATSQHRFTLPDEAPIMRQVMGFLGDQARTLLRAGVSRDRIAIDPGPGFDKFADEDIVIQRANRSLVSMGYPVVCAVSRKRFVGAVSATLDPLERDPATQAICLSALTSGVKIFRVHDVAGAAQSMNAFWAMQVKDARRGFISLGSDVGERINYLTRAIQQIDDIPLTCVVNVSNAYETAGAYGLSGTVANAVAEIRTELHPLVLLDHLMRIERDLGRVRDEAHEGPSERTIDLDLCWIEGETHAGAKLTLPHPGMGERDYVMLPLEDLIHDPARYLTHSGVKVLPREERVGQVLANLGEIVWE